MPTNRHFTGVLAVLHSPTADGRRLDNPGPELTRALPLPLMSSDGHPAGRIERVWLDGNLLRYSGNFLSGTETSQALVKDELVVGNLDVGNLDRRGVRWENRYKGLPVEGDVPLNADPSDFEIIAHDWLVAGVTLGPSDRKAWPEVTLTLDESAS